MTKQTMSAQSLHHLSQQEFARIARSQRARAVRCECVKRTTQCICIDHPVYGVEVNGECPLHGNPRAADDCG
jgi:hypothetical protein